MHPSLLKDRWGRIARSVSLRVQDPSAHILFTSGGTESNNLVIQQKQWQFIITSQTEHHSVLHTCEYMMNHTDCNVAFLPVDSLGRVNVTDLQFLLEGQFAGKKGLVTLAYANNETGTVLDLDAIGKTTQEAYPVKGSFVSVSKTRMRTESACGFTRTLSKHPATCPSGWMHPCSTSILSRLLPTNSTVPAALEC